MIVEPRHKAPTPSCSGAARSRLVLALLVVAALLGPRAALAIQSVVVLDLDGYGVEYDAVQVMTQGLRDGFLEEGTFDPLTGYDISEGLSVGQGDSLRRARELLADARQRMDANDSASALRMLAEVLAIHESAWSWVGRRPELADAHYFTAVALAKLGRSTEAVDHLVECIYLYPGYETGRAIGAGSVSGLFTRARAQLAAAERRSVPGTRVATISERLSSPYVVTGYVVDDGTVHLSIHQNGRLLTEATDYADELPLYPGDPFFFDMAVRLVGGGSGSTPASSSNSYAPVDVNTGIDDGFGDFHEIPDVNPEPVHTGSIGTSDGGHLTDQGSAYDASRRPSRRRSEHTMKGIRYERKPVVETWWFWTGVTAVVAGAGVGLYILLQDEGVITQDPQEQESYTVTLDPSGVEAR
jgi:hypothetical protein